MPSRLKRQDESGHIHFLTISTFHRLQFFHDDGIKEIITTGMKSLRDKHHILLIGYVIMPEHLHLLILPQQPNDEHPIPVSTLLNTFKQYVGFHAKARLREIWKLNGELWNKPLNQWAHGEFGSQQIWKTRCYDRNVVCEQELVEKLDYCHKNPVTRGLVATADEWIWSSYRFYEFGATTPIEMDWDGGWPLRW